MATDDYFDDFRVSLDLEVEETDIEDLFFDQGEFDGLNEELVKQVDPIGDLQALEIEGHVLDLLLVLGPFRGNS